MPCYLHGVPIEELFVRHGSLQDQIGERKCPIRFLNRFQDNCP